MAATGNTGPRRRDASSIRTSPWIFGWLPDQALCEANELSMRIGVAVVRLEAQPDELILSLANGNSVRLLFWGR